MLSQTRFVYNKALEQRIATYQETGEGISYADQWSYFRDLRHEQSESLGQLNATSIQQTLRRLDKSFNAFFKRLKKGETPGFPRFKSWKRFHSMEYSYGDGCKLRFNDRVMFYVQNVGAVKVKYHRPIPENAKLKHVVLKRCNQKWYVSLMLEAPDIEIDLVERPVVGIDMGLHSLLALSDNRIIENPRWMRHSLAKLRVAQRELARKKKGSYRRKKSVAKVAALYERVANQRLDFWHKITRELVNTYGLIALEDLTLKFMTANHSLALSTHDAGLGLFQQLLSYKAEEAGTTVVTVNPAYTSQMCSGCGVIVRKDLSVRTHQCPHCGLKLDRDVNAARNVLQLALNSLGRSDQDVT